MTAKKTEESSRLRRWWVGICVPLYTVLIYGIPVIAVVFPAREFDGGLACGLAPCRQQIH